MIPEVPRPRFQIHLSTCVVVMIIAAVLLCWNIKTPYQSAPKYTFGWPAEVTWTPEEDRASYPNSPYAQNGKEIGWIIINVIFCLVLIGATARYWEKWIAWKSQRTEWKSILLARCAVFLGLFSIVGWLSTFLFGTPAAMNSFQNRLAKNQPGLDVIPISPTELKLPWPDSPYTRDVAFAQTPFPFVVRVRWVDPSLKPYDIEHSYYFWFFGYCSDPFDVLILQHLRRK